MRPQRWHPPGSPIPGILQARTQEWLAISFSNAWKWKVKVKSLRLSAWKLHSRVWLLATPWTAVYQAPLSMGFSRQEYRSGLPFPSSGDPPNPEIWTHISCIDRRILYHCATWEAQPTTELMINKSLVSFLYLATFTVIFRGWGENSFLRTLLNLLLSCQTIKTQVSFLTSPILTQSVLTVTVR